MPSVFFSLVMVYLSTEVRSLSFAWGVAAVKKLFTTKEGWGARGEVTCGGGDSG